MKKLKEMTPDEYKNFQAVLKKNLVPYKNGKPVEPNWFQKIINKFKKK